MSSWETTTMFEMLSYEFMQRALIASVVIGLVCSIIGVFVILKNLTFIGAGTSHAAFAGVTLGYLIGFSPLSWAILFSLITVWIVGYLSKKGYLKLDASVGIFYSLTMALAVLFIGLMKGYNAEVYGYLFGSILSVTKMDLAIILILGTVVLFIVYLFFKEFHFITFDEEMARASGIPTTWLSFLLLTMIAMTIVISLKSVGAILVFALIVTPAAAAYQLTYSMIRMFLYSTLIGIGSSVGGVFISYWFDLPSGATTVLFVAALFFLSLLFSPKRGTLLIRCFLFFALLSLSATKAISAEKSETEQKPAYGDTLVEGTIGEPSILIPMLAGDSASHDVAGLVFNGLVKYDKDLTLVGDLAESWDISKDGLVITFHLRKGVKWTDGVEFTAEDVLFGYKTIIDEKTPTAYSEDYKQVKKAEVLDPYTFRVAYDKPFAPALSSWGSLTILPKHLLEGKDITKSELGRRPVGMGPFKLARWTPGQEVILESNHDYFEGRPYIDRYVYRVIPDAATMFLELQAGGIDWMGLTPTQYTRQTVTPYFEKNFNKYRYPTFAYTYMGFNLCIKRDASGKCVARHPWFGDKRVRQAIAYAIDKDEIVDGVLFGLGKPATGPYVPNTWPYNPDVKRYEYNPGKAKALLAEAGWRDTDGDGLLDKDGRPFEFTILTNMGNSLRMKTATIIQWRLAMIGIKVNIRALEWSTFINEFIDKRRFEVVVLGWGIGLDPDQYDIWHSSKVKEKEFNFVSYANPEVDELLEQGRRTFDMNERKKAYFRIQEILADELPYIFLYVPDALPIVHSRFQGIEPAPIGIGYNINKWYVPEGLQKHRVGR